MLLVDPELAESVADLPVKHRVVLGTDTDGELFLEGREPEPWDDQDEDATATINYTSGTTARPKGVRADPPQPLDQRGHLRLAHRRERPRHLPAHAADVPLQRLGHAVRAHRDGRAAGRAAQGRRRRHPAPHRRARRHAAVRRAGRRGHGARRRRRRGTGRSPGTAARASSWPAPRRPPARSSGSRPSSAGSSSRSTASPRRRRCSRSTAPGPSGTTSSPAERAAKLSPGRRARRRHRPAGRRPGRGAGPRQPRPRGLLGPARGHRRRARRRLVPHRRRRHARRRRLPHDQRPQEGRDHLRRRERQLDRGRGRAVLPPGGGRGVRDRRARREVGRDGQGARRAGARAPAPPRTSCGPGARSAWPATSARRRSSSATSWPAPPPASSRSSSSGPRTGKAASAR